MNGFVNINTILSKFSQVKCEAPCIKDSTITESRTIVLLTEFWHIAVSFTRQPANRTPILETDSSFQKQAKLGKSIESSSNLNAVFSMKRIAGYKLKCCSLLGLMMAPVIIKYSVSMLVYM